MALDKLALPVSDVTCNVMLPLGGIKIIRNCENKFDSITSNSISIINKESVPSKIREISQILSSNDVNHSGRISSNNTLNQTENNYLHGLWSFSGYYGSQLITSRVTLNPSNSYNSTGYLWNGDLEFQYRNRGNYFVSLNDSKIFFLENNGSAAIYMIEMGNNNSFLSYNPNSMEYYSWSKISN